MSLSYSFRQSKVEVSIFIIKAIFQPTQIQSAISKKQPVPILIGNS